MTLRDFQKELESIYNWSTKGCGNHGCVINPPKGMGTNASCQCYPQAFAAGKAARAPSHLAGHRRLYLCQCLATCSLP